MMKNIKPTSYLFAAIMFVFVALTLQSQSNDPPVIPAAPGGSIWFAWFTANWDKILSIITAIVGLFAVKGRVNAAREANVSAMKSVFKGQQIPNPPKE